MTYRGILGGFGLAAFECHSVTLMLETLGGNEALDAGSLGVGFLAFALGLNFAANDEFADLVAQTKGSASIRTRSARVPPRENVSRRQRNWVRREGGKIQAPTSSSRPKPKNLRIFVALFGPNLFGNTLSVSPGISSSPCFTTLNASTDKSIATMHPRTLFLLRSPVRRGR